MREVPHAQEPQPFIPHLQVRRWPAWTALYMSIESPPPHSLAASLFSRLLSPIPRHPSLVPRPPSPQGVAGKPKMPPAQLTMKYQLTDSEQLIFGTSDKVPPPCPPPAARRPAPTLPFVSSQCPCPQPPPTASNISLIT